MQADKRNRLIFFGVFAFLLIQAAIGIGLKYTIFPSLIFPGFSTSAKFDKPIELNALNLYAIEDKDKYVLLDKEVFFDNIYYKYVNFLVKTIIIKEAGKPGHKVSEADKKSFREYVQVQLKRHYPNRRFSGLLVVEGKKVYDIENNSAGKDIINKHETFVWFKPDTH